jgi:hypothetical protein
MLLAIEVEYTREKLLAELENARSVAEKAKNGSAMAMATLGKAKMLGLIIDRREVGEVGAFDNMTDEQLVEEAKKRPPTSPCGGIGNDFGGSKIDTRIE